MRFTEERSLSAEGRHPPGGMPNLMAQCRESADGKVAECRQLIAAGQFEIPERISGTVDRLIAELA
jgi:hypothetical protein